MDPVRVLIIDDSPTIRKLIKAMFIRDMDIEVVGEASDPYEARELIKQLNPDVLTLDVEMPRMNGIEFLEKIMRLRPMPTVLFSTLTKKGTAISVDALSLGAFDCVAKPERGDLTEAIYSLAEKVKMAAGANVKNRIARTTTKGVTDSNFKPNKNVVAIGSSTGGVEALISIISKFPANCPPTAITQHMPPSFTESFAKRMNKTCAPNVVEAKDGMTFEAGTVYIAPGGDKHMIINNIGGNPVCRMEDGGLVSGHCPSVDMMMASVAQAFGKNVVGVILTGMGRDGAKGMMKILEAGGNTFGQDESTSVVYGMPRVAFEKGAVQRQLKLNSIPNAILDSCNKNT